MSSKKLNYKNIINLRSNKLKRPLKLALLREKEKAEIKKNRFAKKVSITELDLTKKESILNKFNIKHNQNNEKILNQIKIISYKIFENNSQEKKRKILDDLLSINSNKKKYNYILQKDDKNSNDIRQKNLFKLSASQNNQIKKDNLKEESFSILNFNPEDKLKKCFYIIKQDKSKEKEKMKDQKYYYLPPINKFKYKYHKIKLKINNSADQDEEENKMKLYKELELHKKHKFII